MNRIIIEIEAYLISVGTTDETSSFGIYTDCYQSVKSSHVFLFHKSQIDTYVSYNTIC